MGIAQKIESVWGGQPHFQSHFFGVPGRRRKMRPSKVKYLRLPTKGEKEPKQKRHETDGV